MAVNTFTPLSQDKHASLPVFVQNDSDFRTYYTPGYMAVVPRALTAEFEGQLNQPGTVAHPIAAKIIQQSAEALRKWDQLFGQSFAPVSLNLYLHDHCNLACQYCYSRPDLNTGAALEPELIGPAAELVAQNCVNLNKPMTVVFHGGGEPSLHPQRLRTALEIVEKVAAIWELPLFRYIATNGVMPASQAAWLAQKFDLIGLSCDGPESIQSRQRPLHDHRSSTPLVERTARILAEAGARVELRVTITPQSVNQQVEIARYLCAQLNPAAIRVEAVYQTELMHDGFSPNLAGEFVREFLRARRMAHHYGVPWLGSGSRPGELHASPCPLLQQALQIIPGGSAMACFKVNNPQHSAAAEALIGTNHPGNHEAAFFALHPAQIERLQARLEAYHSSCPDCFNRYHCARGCPDACVLQGDGFEGGFRCQVEKSLMEARLSEVAARLWENLEDKTAPGSCAVNLDLIA